MSEEILEQESEEITEEELSEKSKAKVEQDSSDEPEDDEDEEEVEESQDVARGDKDGDGQDDSSKDIDPSKAKLKKESAIPKTKNGMLKSVYEVANKLKKDELAAKYESILKAFSIVEEEEGEEDDEEEKVESKRTKVAVKAEDLKIDVKDDVEALVSGDDSLSEEFKKKASTIFEAAVNAKVLEEVNAK